MSGILLICIAEKVCVVKKISNGWIVELDRKIGKMKFECVAGFRAAFSNTLSCNDGKWSSEPKCEGEFKAETAKIAH